MGSWTASRARALTRRADGTFKRWAGGRSKSQLAKKENTFQGIKTHIGKEYIRQHGRIARIGAIVRTKRKDGQYHKGAFWYVRTFRGWRRFGVKKPTRAQVLKLAVVGVRLYATGDIAAASKELGVTPTTVIRYLKERRK